MKVATNLKAGNFLDNAIQTSSQGMQATVAFLNKANQSAENIIKNANSGLQAARNTLFGWI